jgi:hypothetical protein
MKWAFLWNFSIEQETKEGKSASHMIAVKNYFSAMECNATDFIYAAYVMVGWSTIDISS